MLALHGDIDTAAAASLLPVAAATVAGDRSLRIDFSAVTSIDPGVLRQLLMCEAALGRDGVDIKLRHVSAEMRAALERAHLDYLIEMDAPQPVLT